MTTRTSYHLHGVEPSRSIPNHPIYHHPYISFVQFHVYQTLRIRIPMEVGNSHFTHDFDVPEATKLIQNPVLAIVRSVLLERNSNKFVVEYISRLLSVYVKVPQSMHEQIMDRVSMVARQVMIENNGVCPGMSIDVNIEAMVTLVMELNEFEAIVRANEESIIETDQMFKPLPATKSSIETLEKVTLPLNGANCLSACAICMDQFEFGLEVSRLPCLHIYHLDCIVQWLETSHMCPLCRFPLPHESS